ncbi:uncharacterized protein LACBIDRAFT_301428 [Laccaria bicolor S238N-H82]|uniref:Predicted protein n=1 Tax=Laccaria bicolor (strain S238N-H82 / ATCC MYA-4686) TaxID=486041 RepID=B0CNI6_LACBS|nr:uncharacterized protein LACBIDRAFT_301428 [Laccaria bicolor S238N-H82]EDR15314.1 predicted protein [Laccaria bicolor S238N-H82]|eukprot:XP_001873522.1 predicted protein [Laccaria bicolor S238N-H82]
MFKPLPSEFSRYAINYHVHALLITTIINHHPFPPSHLPPVSQPREPVQVIARLNFAMSRGLHASSNNVGLP